MNAAPAVRRLTRLAVRIEAAPDAELLRRYVATRDADAFAALVERHGAMVLGVCRRVTGDTHAADDAYQAAFLALARRAATIRSPEALPAWLFGTARRVALRARDRLNKQRTAPPADTAAPGPDPLDRLSAREFLTILDDELARLPAKYRSAVLLCCLEGLTVEAAARHLGSTAGAVRGWLQRGRERLGVRLERRGLTLGSLVALAAGAVPSSSLAASARGFGSPPAVVPATVSALLARPSLASPIAGLFLVAVSVVGIGLALFPAQGAPPEKRDRNTQPGTAEKVEGPTVDQLGDPLPAGAIARLGTMRLRHGGTVQGLSISPDGKEIATAGLDGVLHVWDATTGKERLRLTDPLGHGPGAGNDLTFVTYSPDGRLLAAARMNQRPAIWDARTGRKLREVGTGSTRGDSVRFSPDGKYLAVHQDQPFLNDGRRADVASVETGQMVRALVDGTILFPAVVDRFIHRPAAGESVSLHRLPDGAEVRRFAGHRGAVLRTQLSGDGRRLFTLGADETVRVWDSETAEEVARLDGAGAGTSWLIPGPDGTTVMAVGQDRSRLALWDVSARRSRWEAKVDAQWDKVTAVHFLPGGEILTGHEYGAVRAWDPATGREVRAARPQSWNAVRLAVSPDGKTMATVVNSPLDMAVVLTDPATFKPKIPGPSHQAQIRNVVFRPDGHQVATGAWDGTLRLWEARTGKPGPTIQGSGVGTYGLSPDGKTLFTAGWSDGKVRVYDPATGHLLREWASGDPRSSALIVSGDGRTVVTVGDRVRSWDARAGVMVREFEAKARPWRIALSPDGRTLALADFGGALGLWDVRTGRKETEIGRASKAVGAVAFSPDGSLLAWTDSDHGIRLSDAGTGRVVRTLSGPLGTDDTLAFSPDGKSLAWAGTHIHREARLWEVRTGQIRRTFLGHDGPAGTVAFSPDGSLLVTAGPDGAALVWDVHGREAPTRAANSDQLAEWWDALSGPEAARAYAAMTRLRAAGPVAIAMIRDRLPPVARPDEKLLKARIAELDSDAFRVRERTTEELARLGEAAAGALRQAETTGKTEEARARARRLLEATEAGRLQRERAVEVLEMIGDADAAKVLAALAAGAPDAPLTRDAAGAVKRLGR
jgi:RNA polymerase sigma factor (sigma-70 family)